MERFGVRSTKMLYCAHRKHFFTSTISTSTVSIFPYIPLCRTSHSFHTMYSDNHMIPFASDKQFGLVDTSKGTGEKYKNKQE
jgi:hypothetical protein